MLENLCLNYKYNIITKSVVIPVASDFIWKLKVSILSIFSDSLAIEEFLTSRGCNVQKMFSNNIVIHRNIAGIILLNQSIGKTQMIKIDLNIITKIYY